MRSNREEKNKKLIEYLNNKINIQPSSLRVLKKLTKRDPNSYLFGGCVRNACYAVLHPEAANLNKATDTDALTSAATEKVKSDFPGMHKSKIVPGVLILRTNNYADDLDIVHIPRCDEIIEKSRLGQYFDCSINSIMYHSKVGLIDLSGHGLADLQNGIIDVFEVESSPRSSTTTRLIRGLRFKIRLIFRLSDETMACMQMHRPIAINETSSTTHRSHLELLKLLNEGDIKTTLMILQESLSAHVAIKLIDFLLPDYMSKAIQKFCKTQKGLNHVADVIEKAMNEYSIDRVYYELTISSLKISARNEFSLFANRHQQPDLQRKLDKRLGLTK